MHFQAVVCLTKVSHFRRHARYIGGNVVVLVQHHTSGLLGLAVPVYSATAATGLHYGVQPAVGLDQDHEGHVSDVHPALEHWNNKGEIEM